MYEERTSQAAALFLLKAGGTMSDRKLMELLYIADRESYRLYGSPITGDDMCSTPHGPVLSRTLDLMNGKVRQTSDHWSAYVGPLDGGALSVADGVTEETELDLLSEANLSVIEDVWTRCGRMSAKEIEKRAHAFPEWENPRGPSRPIERYALFKALGMDDAQAEALVERNEERDAIDAAFERMREPTGRAT